jgi:release factor glutamine methyltransferase
MRGAIVERLSHLGPVSPSIVEAVEARIARGVPLSRATGVAFFGDAVLETEGVLCPRADSECVVEAAVRHCANVRAPRVVDLGCGSGALLIWFLQLRSDAQGLGVDQCEQAVKMTKLNMLRNNITRPRVVHRSWNAPMLEDEACFDVAMWNPPYVQASECGAIADPIGALDGGSDGLDCYRSAPWHYVKRKGMMVVEIGYGARDSVVKLMSEAGVVRDVVKDLQGKYLYLLSLFKKTKTKTKTQELIERLFLKNTDERRK